jgi:hypothetical protein
MVSTASLLLPASTCFKIRWFKEPIYLLLGREDVNSNLAMSEKIITSYEKILTSADHSLGWKPRQRRLEPCHTLASDYLSRGAKQKARETLATLLNLWEGRRSQIPYLRRPGPNS